MRIRINREPFEVGIVSSQEGGKKLGETLKRFDRIQSLEDKPRDEQCCKKEGGF